MKNFLLNFFYKLQVLLFGKILNKLEILTEKNNLNYLINLNSANETYQYFKEDFKKTILIQEKNPTINRKKILQSSLVFFF